MNWTVEIPAELADKVISIEVLRKSRFERQLSQECTHDEIIVDVNKYYVECKSCHELLNLVEWIASLAEKWQRIIRLYHEYNEALERYNKRSRVKCRHCGQFTPVER